MNEKFSFIAHRWRYYRTNNSMILYSILKQKKSENDSTVGQKFSKVYLRIFNVRGIYLFFISIFLPFNKSYIY